jgi:hypothetical protein
VALGNHGSLLFPTPRNAKSPRYIKRLTNNLTVRRDASIGGDAGHPAACPAPAGGNEQPCNLCIRCARVFFHEALPQLFR